MSASEPRGPLKAMTIRQPFAWLVTAGVKSIENRGRTSRHRGLIAIHASKAMPQATYQAACKLFGHGIDPALMHRGAIIGVAELVRVVEQSRSRWFFGPYGYVLENPVEIEPIACIGQLGIWTVPPRIAAIVHSRISK